MEGVVDDSDAMALAAAEAAAAAQEQEDQEAAEAAAAAAEAVEQEEAAQAAANNDPHYHMHHQQHTDDLLQQHHLQQHNGAPADPVGVEPAPVHALDSAPNHPYQQMLDAQQQAHDQHTPQTAAELHTQQGPVAPSQPPSNLPPSNEVYSKTHDGQSAQDTAPAHTQQPQASAPPPPPEADQPQDQQQQQQQQQEAPMVCRICGKGPQDDGRILCRFLPVELDPAAAAASPHTVTFSQDIALHVFCGKTASILPNVNQPELEILSKAGIKNKHGIGPEVNGALARTRSSVISSEGGKEKTFYLVKEFEAHLAAIRNASTMHHHHHQQQAQPPQHHHHHPNHHHTAPHHHPHATPHHAHHQPHLLNHHVPPPIHHHPHHHPHHVPPTLPPAAPTVAEYSDDIYGVAPTPPPPAPPPTAASTKQVPHKAGTTYQKRDPWALPPPPPPPAPEGTAGADGKVRCGCGGTHLQTGTPKGDASWRAHVMSKRHQKWMEENGLLGAV